MDGLLGAVDLLEEATRSIDSLRAMVMTSELGEESVWAIADVLDANADRLREASAALEGVRAAR